jgi:hypothetical protein
MCIGQRYVLQFVHKATLCSSGSTQDSVVLQGVNKTALHSAGYAKSSVVSFRLFTKQRCVLQGVHKAALCPSGCVQGSVMFFSLCINQCCFLQCVHKAAFLLCLEGLLLFIFDIIDKIFKCSYPSVYWNAVTLFLIIRVCTIRDVKPEVTCKL